MKWIPFDTPLEQHPKYGMIMYLSRSFWIDPILGHYLFAHGFDSEEKLSKFFYPDIINDLHNPFLLNDMKKAIIRIVKAIKQKEKILIFGDYDVDGITSTTILFTALKRFKGNVSFRLPLRSEGYGLSAEAIKQVEPNTSLIITVDNGSSAHEALKVAKEKGIDVIVTDHHEILGEFPNCYAFINPKRHDSTYPFSELAGAGVAFKVVQALYQVAKRKFDRHFASYLELATLGTIADMMPIKDENRTICKEGLHIMNISPHPVFKKIFGKNYVKNVDSSTVGFTLGPIFNSCGRIDDPNIAVQILTTDSISDNDVDYIINLNKNRKELTNTQFLMADNQIKAQELHKDKVIVVFDEFHNGIIGIIASKITEKYKKPAIVVSHTGTGSARSVNGTDFSIVNAIDSCSEQLIKYGGHQAAAGLSITPEMDKIEMFRHSIQMNTQNLVLAEPVQRYIGEMHINHFSTDLFDDINCIEPYGINLPKPVFYCPSHSNSNCEVFGKSNNHLKLFYGKKHAISFFKGSLSNHINQRKPFNFLYTTHCRKKRNFIIQDIRLEGSEK